MQRLAQAYALDPRSLALMRILVGLGFVVTRLINLPHVREFYTDHGSYPRVCAVLLPSLVPYFPHGGSLFNAVGNDTGVFLLYFLTIAVGLAVTVGYRTRLSTACCWVLGFSVYNRCPVINPASDAEILLCLFFGTFLPWGDMWSVDARASTEVKPYLSAATLGWRLQVAALYLTAAMSKTSYHWGNGSASLVSMKSDAWSSFIGRWVATLLDPYPSLARDLTNYVVIAEFVLPFMLLIPQVRIQLLGVVGLALMHITFGLCLHLEAFTPLALACLSGFIPPFAWAYLTRPQQWIEWCLARLPGPPHGERPAAEKEDRFLPLGPLSSAFMTWAVIGIVWSCAISVKSAPMLAERALEPWHAFGLQQSWGMFNPPPYQGGWYVFRGKTLRGEWVNLEATPVPVDSLSMPAELDQTLPTSRHVLLYNALITKSKPMLPLQERIAEDFRIRWESAHPDPMDRLQELEMYKYYREYDCEAGTFSKPELKFTYKKNL